MAARIPSEQGSPGLRGAARHRQKVIGKPSSDSAAQRNPGRSHRAHPRQEVPLVGAPRGGAPGAAAARRPDHEARHAGGHPARRAGARGGLFSQGPEARQPRPVRRALVDLLALPLGSRPSRSRPFAAPAQLRMTKFKPKLSILPKEQKALWPHLAPAKDLGFTLYGGSAIALRLGHRSSVDFDFFTEKTLAKNALYKAIPVLKGSDVLQEAPDALVVSVTPPRSENPVKLSFFAKMNFGRFGTPELTDDGVLRVASLDDLMA